MFKKTLVAAAIATTAFGANAYEIGLNNDFSVEVYGVAAMSAVNYNISGNKGTGANEFALENESRIGFRAGKEMVEGLTVFMQIESGYVDNVAWSHGGSVGGVLGFRDTFVGLKGDSWGQVRFGRVLTPLYEIVDWPFSNPGLGTVFDWGGDVVANYDRQSNQIRYDSPNWSGFSFAASVGKDQNVFGGTGTGNEDSFFVGANIRYSYSMLNLMAAVEAGQDFKGNDGLDNMAYIVGVDLALPAGFGLAGAYKGAELDDNGVKHSQGSYSAILQYWNGPIGFKIGYAANLDSELAGDTQDDADSVTSVQLMGVINGFVPYIRVANRNQKSSTVTFADNDIVTRIGIEYGF